MKRLLLVFAPLLGACFQAWTADGLYRCGGGCPEGMVCDDDVCCRDNGTPACPTRVPDGGRCSDGAAPKTFFADRDKDGYGNAAEPHLACSRPLTEPFVDNDDDCDDGSSAAQPGGSEICDGRDNDCDLQIDEGQSPLQAYYRDIDGDRFGVLGDTLMACACANDGCVPPGYAPVSGDCAPMDNARYPGAMELCNGLDDDCDNQNDDGVTVGVGAACADAGPGDCLQGTTGCVAGAIRCVSTAMPSRDVCDGRDNNCNGTIDEQPDCGGPNLLLEAGVSITGARDSQSNALSQASPNACWGRDGGVGEGWTPRYGPWSGSSESFHIWYAEAPANTTWDLSRADLKLHLQFTTQMFNNNVTFPWNQFNQPFLLLCNADRSQFSRYRPLTMLMSTANASVNTDVALAGDGGWIIAKGGVDLTQVKRIEVVVEPSDNGAANPSFNITFNPSTGFKP